MAAAKRATIKRAFREPPLITFSVYTKPSEAELLRIPPRHMLR